MQIKLYGRDEKGVSGRTIKTTLPYIKEDIPIVIVFRALGLSLMGIFLEHICYDANDWQMLEILKPCVEEGFVIQEREVALDFIGRRGVGIRRENVFNTPRIFFKRNYYQISPKKKGLKLERHSFRLYGE